MSKVISLPFTGPQALDTSLQNFNAFQRVHSSLEKGPRNRVETALKVQEGIFDEANTPEDLRAEFRRSLGVSEWGNILGTNHESSLNVEIASGALNIAHTSGKPEVSMKSITEEILRNIYGITLEAQAELREKIETEKAREDLHPVDLIFDELKTQFGAPQTISSDIKSEDVFPNLISFLRIQINITPEAKKLIALKKAARALNVIAKDDSLRELFQAIDKTLDQHSPNLEKHIVTIMQLIADLDLAAGNKKEELNLLRYKHPFVIGALAQARDLAEKAAGTQGAALRNFYDATLRRVEDTTTSTTHEVIGAFSPSKGKTLLEKYGINPEKVNIVNQSKYINEGQLAEINANKELYLIKLLEAHEHALKNRKLKTSYFSNRQYATSMELELKSGNTSNTFWALAGNFELNISELICGERGNMTIAVNKAIEMLKKELVDGLPEDANIDNMLKIKRLVMTSSKALGEDKSAWQPCSDCYAWLGSKRFTSPDTQIHSVGKDEAGNLTLEIRTLRDLLPMEDFHLISITDQAIENMPIEYSSDKTKAMIDEIKLSEKMIRKLLLSAKKEYETSEKVNDGFSGKEEASAVLFHESRKIFTGKRIEWVPRWPEPAALVATTNGINELAKKGIKNPTVKAVAHYSDHEEVPNIKTNGRLAQKRGGKDVVHIVIENNIIKVRTIQDYQPHVHGSVRQLSINRTTV